MITGDLTGTILGLVSLAVAGTAFVRTVYNDRRQLLQELHRHFVDPENSWRRKMLYDAHESHGDDWWEKVPREERARINTALAQFDAIALSAVRRHVSTVDALVLWGAAAQKCLECAHGFRQHRAQKDEAHSWIFLAEFAEVARLNPELAREANVESIPLLRRIIGPRRPRGRR